MNDFRLRNDLDTRNRFEIFEANRLDHSELGLTLSLFGLVSFALILGCFLT